MCLFRESDPNRLGKRKDLNVVQDHKRRATDKEGCDTCDYHGPFAELITQAITDLGWIKRIGYVLIALACSFIISVWSVGYPHLVSLDEHISRLETVVVRNTEKIVQLERVTTESKEDRKEIHKCLDGILRIQNLRSSQ